MQPIVHLFTPIFFVTIGLSLNLKTIPWDSPFIWGLSLSLLMAALLGKVLSGFLLIKEKQMVRWAIGIAMIPRGEVGLIFAEIGKSSGAFNNDLYDRCYHNISPFYAAIFLFPSFRLKMINKNLYFFV